MRITCSAKAEPFNLNANISLIFTSKCLIGSARMTYKTKRQQTAIRYTL